MSLKEYLKKAAYLYGRMAAYALSIWYAWLFFLAYKAPAKGAVLWIDAFNEAHIESVIMIFTMAMIFYSITVDIQTARKNRAAQNDE